MIGLGALALLLGAVVSTSAEPVMGPNLVVGKVGKPLWPSPITSVNSKQLTGPWDEVAASGIAKKTWLKDCTCTQWYISVDVSSVGDRSDSLYDSLPEVVTENESAAVRPTLDSYDTFKKPHERVNCVTRETNSSPEYSASELCDVPMLSLHLVVRCAIDGLLVTVLDTNLWPSKDAYFVPGGHGRDATRGGGPSYNFEPALFKSGSTPPKIPNVGDLWVLHSGRSYMILGGPSALKSPVFFLRRPWVTIPDSDSYTKLLHWAKLKHVNPIALKPLYLLPTKQTCSFGLVRGMDDEPLDMDDEPLDMDEVQLDMDEYLMGIEESMM